MLSHTMLSSLLVALALSSQVQAGPHFRNANHRRHHAKALKARDGCVDSAWQCAGSDLQRCTNGTWKTLRTCSGELVCSADPSAIGCIWSWSNPESGSTPSASPTVIDASASVSLGATVTQPVTVVSASALPTATASASTSVGNTTASCDGDDAYEDVWVEEDDIEDEDEELEPYCDEVEGNPAYATPTASATSSAAPSVIGGALLAGGPVASVSQNWDWSASASASASASRDWDWSASASASASANSWDAPSSSSRKHRTSSASASALASAAATGPTSTTSSDLRTWSAPHHVIYADRWLRSLPSASSMGSFNRFILAFWMTSGPADNAIAWQQMSSDVRSSTIADYHANGIALMVSAFGATDSPTTNGADPVQTAQDLAQFVKNYGLDGVDIDYEDMTAMNTNKAEAWIIPFQQELRRQLPSPYIITHAPVAPWFTSAGIYPSGAYVGIHEAVGDSIDFYSIQFYNQGDGVYGDCESLLHSSGGYWPSTSVFEINSHAGVPLEKIVIGKPLDAGMASNGYVGATALAQCVSEAQSKGWNAGVMFWEWTSEATGIVGTVLGN